MVHDQDEIPDVSNNALMVLDLKVGYTSQVIISGQKMKATKGFGGLSYDKRECLMEEEFPEVGTPGLET